MNLYKNKDIAFIVYQMGKVGSSTIYNSLEKMYGEERVLHTHNHEMAKEYIEKWSESFDSVVVITGFREPLARCISAYFENLTNEKNHWFVGPKEDVLRKRINWLINDFNTKAVPHIQNVVGPWLENYERITNCKLTNFTEAKGCLKGKLNNVYFYIYKLENLTEFFQGFSDDPFLNKVKAVNSNISSEKWYAPIYSEFRKEYQISETSYDELYGDIGFVHLLYDQHEINDLTKRFLSEEKP